MSDQAVQSDPPITESFWRKDSLITHILFELWLIMISSPVANFAQQSLLTQVQTHVRHVRTHSRNLCFV